MIPRARTKGVTTSELNDETVVYDLDRHRVHRLNRTAALVWKRCDGKSSVADIAADVERELAAPASEELVHQALDQLEQALLLEDAARISRREFGQRVRLTGALLVLAPVVTSIVAPTAAQAQSGKGNNGSGQEKKGKDDGAPPGFIKQDKDEKDPPGDRPKKK